MNFRIIRAHTDAPPPTRTLKRIQRHATNDGGEKRGPRIETRETIELAARFNIAKLTIRWIG